MVGNFMDEIDCNSFFDQIDDLLDFSAENIDVCFPKGSPDSFPPIWDTPTESLPNSDSVFCGNNSNSNNNDLSAELSVPYEDIVQLEWLSNFVEDSFTGGDHLTIKKEDSAIDKVETSSNQFRTSSPVSVLESSSSCSGGEKNASTSPLSPQTTASGRCGRARSKRPRPAAFSPRPPIQLISVPYPIAESTQGFVAAASKASSDSENFAESRQIIRIPKHVITEHKKKRMKMSAPLAPVDENQGQQPVRKCMHCEITKTPQWRAGPMGPKTLCNACGVRYKSGRLYPEYRPAASPTFVPSLHSNSHKKVVEMRTKNIERVAAVAQAVKSASEPPLLIPNNNATVDYS